MNRAIEIRPGEIRCPACFALDVVPSRPRGWRDSIMARMRRVPRHCRACGRRFYVSEELLADRARADRG